MKSIDTEKAGGAGFKSQWNRGFVERYVPVYMLNYQGSFDHSM